MSLGLGPCLACIGPSSQTLKITPVFTEILDASTRVIKCLGVPRTVLVLALKFLCPGKLLSPEQTGTVGHSTCNCSPFVSISFSIAPSDACPLALGGSRDEAGWGTNCNSRSQRQWLEP